MTAPARRARWAARLGFGALLAVLAAACGDEGPVSGPGVLTATVVTPNAAEGAAVVRLTGTGIGEVTALGGWVFEERLSDGVRVVVVNDEPGPLRFQVAVADTTQPLLGTVDEVAGPDDQLRSLTGGGYTVSVGR